MNIFRLLKPKVTVAYLKKNNTIRQGIEKMQVHGYSAIPVIDDNGEYIGTVSEGDFLRFILENRGHDPSVAESSHVIQIVNEERNQPVRVDTTMKELLLRVMDQNFVPVTDDRNIFIGIVTRRDVIKYYYDKYNIDKSAADQGSEEK